MSPSDALAWFAAEVQVSGSTADLYWGGLLSDGRGGAFVCWTANLPPSSEDAHCFVQHLGEDGQPAPGWPAGGIVVGDGPGEEGALQIVSDGAGGVLLLVVDTGADPDGDIRLVRYTAEGTPHSSWGPRGTLIAASPGRQTGAFLAGDGNGGAWVTWADRPDPFGPYTAVYITHVLGTGDLASGWPENGRTYEPLLAPQVSVPIPYLLDDGSVVTCFSVSNSTSTWGSSAILARRHDPDGTPSSIWPSTPVVLCPELHGSRGSFLEPDGTGGFFAAWTDYSRTQIDWDEWTVDVYAQHLLGDGSLAPGWPATGVPIASHPYVEEEGTTFCADRRGGVFVAWTRPWGSYAYMQLIGPDGQPRPGWPADGVFLGRGSTLGYLSRLVADGGGGVYLPYAGEYLGEGRLMLQHMTRDGVPAPGWPEGGQPIDRQSGLTHSGVRACSDEAGGVIVAWAGTADAIFARRFVSDGTVAAAVSLVSTDVSQSGVRLRWHVRGANSAIVERREALGEWGRRAALEPDGNGQLEYLDVEVTPGTRYEYRITLADGTHAGHATVEVPAAFVVALEGARPNPARGPLRVVFTLPDATPAQLELFDVSGRRISVRGVGQLGHGRHAVRLDDETLSPGLYWVALSRGEQKLNVRVAVTE